MAARRGALLAILSVAACSSVAPDRGTRSDGGLEADGSLRAEGGVRAEGGTVADAGAPPDGATPDGGKSLDASGAQEAGTTVTPGNGCPAALGIDAGFYTCARQFFVSPSGNDSNRGASLAQALQTIGGATKLPLQGGDCVTVESGTYDETVSIGTSGSADTCTGYVVFRSASPGGAKIVSTDQYQAVTVAANYVTFDGFDVEDTSTGSAFVAGTNNLVSGHVVVNHHIIAIRNLAHDSGGAGLSAIHADYIRFEGNAVYNNCATSPYGDSGIDLWEAQSVDDSSGWNGFHIIVRNNISYQNAEWDLSDPTDGEGILLDTFDYADPTYGTTPYAQHSLVENNVVWGNGGRGIEASGVGPTSYVTFRNNTVFDNNRQNLPWPGAEIHSLGNDNVFDNNIAIVGPDDVDGTGGGLTQALEDSCGTQGGVVVNTGSVWRKNIAFSMLSGSRLAASTCPAPISTTVNLLGDNPALAAPSLSATTADPFRIGASSPAVHAGTSADMASFDFAYVTRSMPPSIGAFEPSTP
jgi:hypothetical protein